MTERCINRVKLVSGVGKNLDWIGGGGDRGWREEWGQEIIEREIVPCIHPGDKVVDLAGGEGRASMSMAMRGARVVVVDNDSSRLGEGDDIRKNAGAKRTTNIVSDIREINRNSIGGGVSVVIASDALNHLAKEEADLVIDQLPGLLNRRRGGFVYVNAPATDGPMFQEPEYFGAERIGPKTLQVVCGCSGELKQEVIPFYERGEIEARLALLGGNIVRTNLIERNNGGVLHEVVAEFRPGRVRK